VSKPVIWVSFAANVSTDMYLISIPLPMLWGSRLPTLKKVASTFILGAGVFVLVCATLKSIFVLVVSLSLCHKLCRSSNGPSLSTGPYQRCTACWRMGYPGGLCRGDHDQSSPDIPPL
jgi:hypothetical protein